MERTEFMTEGFDELNYRADTAIIKALGPDGLNPYDLFV